MSKEAQARLRINKLLGHVEWIIKPKHIFEINYIKAN